MLAWFALIISLIGIIGVGVGTFLAWRSSAEGETASSWPFIITLGGLIAFFIGWLLFLVFLFFSKGLDLNTEARKQLGGILPDPDIIRKEIVEGNDDGFMRFVNG